MCIPQTKSFINLFIILFLSISILLITQYVNGQVAEPCKDFFRPISPGLYDVHLFSENDIIAIGKTGTIIKSNDGGQHWKFVNSGNVNSYELHRLSFPSQNIGYAIGSIGLGMKTEDHGETWFPLSMPLGFNYPRDISFINDSVGFIAGENGYVETKDGGRNWELRLLPYQYQGSFTAIYFINDSTGFLAGNHGKILRTTNSGNTWVPFDISFLGYNPQVNRFVFLSEQTGYAVTSNSRILKTIDGGVSWVAPEIASGGGFEDICFVDENTGYAVGGIDFGFVRKTTNGGQSWELDLSVPITGNIHSVAVDPLKKKLVMIGEFGTSRLILIQDIASQTWESKGNTGGNASGSIYVLDSTHIYSAGAFKTMDGAESYSSLSFESPNTVSNIFMLDTLKGFLSSNKDLFNGEELYQTVDGGLNWTRNSLPDTPVNSNNRIRKIDFLSPSMGFVVDHTTIYKTIDGGNSWQKKYEPPSVVHLMDACFLSSGKAFSVSLVGTLYRSDDFSETWNEVNLNNSNEFFYSVYFFNENLGFIGGLNGLMYKTIDGGNNWFRTNTSMTSNIYSFFFMSETLGYALTHNGAGTYSNLYETRDAGTSWNYIGNGDGPSKLYGKGKILYGWGGINIKIDKVNPVPVLGYIAGPAKSCVGQTNAYKTATINGITYQWSLSGGGNLTPSGSTNTILWNTAGEFTITVTAFNECQSTSRSIQVTVAPEFKPEVTLTDSILTATEGIKYQWFRNFIQIPENEGGKLRSIVASSPANYYVTVTSINGCIEDAPFFYGGFIPFDRFICSGGNVILSTIANAPGNQYQWQLDKGSGYANVSFAQGYSGSTQRTLLTPGLFDTVPFYKFRVRISNGYSVFYGEVFKVKFGSNWTGAISNAWENPGNWSCGVVPNQNTHITIPSGLSNSPVISSNVSCRSVTVATGASIIILSGFNLTITGTRDE